MLKYLSRMERTRSLIIVGFAILMAVSLVVFYAPGRNSTQGSYDKTVVLARVGNEDITIGDLLARIGDESKLSGPVAQALITQLIPRRIIVQEARRLGLTASDAEVAEKIRKNQKDPSGKVDVDKYMSQVGDVTRYEEDIRDDITASKLYAFITASVTVSDEELRSEFDRRNTTFDLVYVPLAIDKLAAKINPAEQELRDYYEQHKNDYYIRDPQKKIRYVFISQDKVMEKIQIPDDKLREAYNSLDEKNKTAGVQVQQIVLKVARPDLDEGVGQKAAKLAADLHSQDKDKPDKVSEEAFANVAKGQSEDPATAKNGGMLPKPFKLDPNKPDPLYGRVIGLQPDDITEPFKYGNNWYILRRGQDVPKTFEDAKPELLASARNKESYAAAGAIAQRAASRLQETKDVQKVAQEFAAEANMKPAEMVRETPYLVPGDVVPDIGSSKQFEDGIAPLSNPNDVGGVTPIKSGFAIPLLVDKKEPRIPDFDEIKDKVLKSVREDRAKSQMEETARSLANSAGNAADLKGAAEKLGLEAKTTPNYSVGRPLGEMDTGTDGEDAIFGLKEGEVKSVKMGDNWVVVGATKRTQATDEEFNRQHDMLLERALNERRSQVFEDYMVGLQRRMESEGKIKIYEDQLAKLGGEEQQQQQPTVTMPQQQQQTITIPQQPDSDRPVQIPQSK